MVAGLSLRDRLLFTFGCHGEHFEHFGHIGFRGKLLKLDNDGSADAGILPRNAAHCPRKRLRVPSELGDFDSQWDTTLKQN